jgi:hypothetical protein
MSKLGERRTDPTDADDERKEYDFYSLDGGVSARERSKIPPRKSAARGVGSRHCASGQEPSRRSAHVDDGDLAAETTCSRAAAP